MNKAVCPFPTETSSDVVIKELEIRMKMAGWRGQWEKKAPEVPSLRHQPGRICRDYSWGAWWYLIDLHLLPHHKSHNQLLDNRHVKVYNKYHSTVWSVLSTKTSFRPGIDVYLG